MTLLSTSPAKYALLTANLARAGNTTIGVLLEDAQRNELHVRLRRDWESIADREEGEVFSLLEDDLRAKGREMGADRVFAWLEENASNSVQVSNRDEVLLEDFERGLNRLYSRHIRSNVVPFRTHLPRYTLQVAAGKFLENEEVTDDGWVEAPDGLRLMPDMFVARIVGHSMEPFIPDDSVCVFRAGVTGSRQGRLVLVEDVASGGNNRYTVKRYKSEKSATAAGWRHERVRLESLNPDYPSWDLDPDEDKYRIIAEFVRVLE